MIKHTYPQITKEELVFMLFKGKNIEKCFENASIISEYKNIIGYGMCEIRWHKIGFIQLYFTRITYKENSDIKLSKKKEKLEYKLTK